MPSGVQPSLESHSAFLVLVDSGLALSTLPPHPAPQPGPQEAGPLLVIFLLSQEP